MRKLFSAALILASACGGCLCNAQMVARRAPLAAASSTVTFDSTFEKATSSGGATFSFCSTGTGCSAAVAPTVAGTVTANSNRVLICDALFDVDTTQAGTVAMTWNGTSMTAIGAGVDGAGSRSSFLFGLIAPAAGNNTLSMTHTGTAGITLAVGCVSVYNADQSTGWHNNASNTGTSTGPTLALTTANGEMAVAGRADSNSTAPRTVSSGTLDFDDGNFDGNYGMAHKAATTASTTITWSLNSSVAWLMHGVSVMHV